MENKTVYMCQKCGKKILKEDIREIIVEKGQQKGLILQVGMCCFNRTPSFRDKGIYK